MFENIPTQSNQPNSPQAGGAPKPEGAVDDIFSKIDTGMAPSGPEKITSMPTGPSPAPVSAGPDKKYFLIGIVVLLFILVVAGAVWVVKNYGSSIFKKSIISPTDTRENNQPVSNEEPQTEEQGGEAVSNIGTSSETNVSTSSISEMLPQPVDSDEDGLTDEEEDALGTDKTNSDTDSDGLFDREEVKVYKTNPTNPDTDGDGYKDGDEVKDGYNPNGAGKLYEIK